MRPASEDAGTEVFLRIQGIGTHPWGRGGAGGQPLGGGVDFGTKDSFQRQAENRGTLPGGGVPLSLTPSRTAWARTNLSPPRLVTNKKVKNRPLVWPSGGGGELKKLGSQSHLTPRTNTHIHHTQNTQRFQKHYSIYLLYSGFFCRGKQNTFLLHSL